MAWQLDSGRPIYGQLVDFLRQRIVTGYYEPGQKIESVRELAQDAGVNPNTMQRALAEMERDGILYTNRTSGRFVTEDAERIKKMRQETAEGVLQGFVKEMRALGFSGQEITALLGYYLREEKDERDS